MRRQGWFKVRIGIMAILAVLVLLLPWPEPQGLLHGSTLGGRLLSAAILGLLCLIALPPMMLLIIGVQSVNPWSDARWRRPTHDANPLNLRDPLQFFHFAAYLVLVQGGAMAISALWRGGTFLALGLLQGLAGLALLLSLRVCLRVFRHKFDAPQAAPAAPAKPPTHP